MSDTRDRDGEGGEPGPARWRVRRVAAFAAALVVAVFLVLGANHSRESVSEAASRQTGPREGAPAESPAGAVRDAGMLGPADFSLLSGETLEISADALPAGRPVALRLQLGEPSANAAPRPGRILVEGREPLELRAAIEGEDRLTARVEVEAGWMATPGRYIVEIRTTERSHLPLRRYAIEVR
jgi:hypothetical protein